MRCVGAALILSLVSPFVGLSAQPWPTLRTYEGEYLRKVKMPLGGIGTGTISLSGRGALVDWELAGRPAKGFTPRKSAYAPHFAIRCESADGKKVARLLEGPLLPEEYEGETGCPVQNQGYPRFARTVFRAAYPLARIDYFDESVPAEVWLEAMNPLVLGNADDSGIPAVLFRWCVRNPTEATLNVSVAGTVLDRIDGVELALEVAEGAGTVTSVDEVREPGWNVGLDRYWQLFLKEGIVRPSDPNEPKSVPARQKCVSVVLRSGETRQIPFVIAWRSAGRKAWELYDSTNRTDVVGNWYAMRYPTAKAAADDLLVRLPELEQKTVSFVQGVLGRMVPEVVKEAALFNLSTLRTETCFRTADGHFYGWEGCYDAGGSCCGSCTHVWGYEHALVDLWPDLARDMLETQFGPAQDPTTGLIVIRVDLPIDRHPLRSGGFTLAAADGQMQCIVKAYEYWKVSGDDAWLKRLWPRIRKAMEFCWIPGGWDADRDGVMEGCQHNTMDVEYYGPNPQMEFLYLAALEAAAAQATAVGDADFAAICRGLRAEGGAWTEKNLFNGSYYEHRVVPPVKPVAEGLRHRTSGSANLKDPDYQLGAGCLIDQLLGDYAARVVGLGSVADFAHARTTLSSVLEKCRHAADDVRFNPMRGFAMSGEESLRMAWYPEGRMPRSPFPYYVETMTGFEYVVAALQVMYGDKVGAERTVRNVRARYDGAKRNPFDEAECGHHYVRALAAWTVLKVWDNDARQTRARGCE